MLGQNRFDFETTRDGQRRASRFRQMKLPKHFRRTENYTAPMGASKQLGIFSQLTQRIEQTPMTESETLRTPRCRRLLDIGVEQSGRGLCSCAGYIRRHSQSKARTRISKELGHVFGSEWF